MASVEQAESARKAAGVSEAPSAGRSHSCRPAAPCSGLEKKAAGGGGLEPPPALLARLHQT